MPVTLEKTSISVILLGLKHSTKLYAKLFFANLNTRLFKVVLNFISY